MDRFHRLVAVEDFRYFRDWTDDELRAPHSFAKTTVIYGPNGSGKSTLAEIFDRLEQSQLDDQPADEVLRGVTFELTNGTTKVERRGDEQLPKVVVFGKRYIERNIQQAFNSRDAFGEALFAVGEPQVKLDQEIEKATGERESAQTAVKEQDTRVSEAEKLLKAQTEVIQSELTGLLGTYSPNVYNQTRFNKTKVANLIDTAPATSPLNDDELNSRTGELEGVAGELIRVPAPVDLSFLKARMTELADHEVVAQAITRLADDPKLSRWAETGLDLHEEGDRCAFCDQEVRPARLEQLRRHFDTSHRKLTGLIKQARDEAASVEQELENAEQALDEASRTETGTAAVIRESREGLQQLLASIREWVQAAREAIDQREGNAFAVVDWDPPSAPDFTVWKGFRSAADEENEVLLAKQQNVEKAKGDAETAIRHHVAAKHRQEFQNARKDRDDEVAAQEALKQTVADLTTELVSLKQSQKEQQTGEPLAGELTSLLERHLGFRNLVVEFVVEDDRAGFRIRRDGKAAEHLSEGERGAIALLHFLTMLRSNRFSTAGGKDDQGLNKHVVVIDDPVSSFDNEAIVGAFTFMREELKGGRCAQLIMLTHNFQYLQLWRRDMEGTKSSNDKRNAEEAEVALHGYFGRKVAVLELRPVLTGDETPRRYSRLRDLGTDGECASEYHLLFKHVAEVVRHQDDSTVLLAGNAGRRLLESFTRWKRPSRNLTDGVSDLAQAHEDALPPDVAQRALKTLQNASHREELSIDTNAHAGHVLKELQGTLKFMRVVDAEHFNGMCKATKVELEEEHLTLSA